MYGMTPYRPSGDLTVPHGVLVTGAPDGTNFDVTTNHGDSWGMSEQRPDGAGGTNYLMTGRWSPDVVWVTVRARLADGTERTITVTGLDRGVVTRDWSAFPGWSRNEMIAAGAGVVVVAGLAYYFWPSKGRHV